MTSIANNESLATVRVKLNNMLGMVHNVKDFGATGDGTTDDRAFIQAAIDWNSGDDRGIIFFPIGNYKVTGPLYLDGTPRGVARAHNQMQLLGAGGNDNFVGASRIFGNFNGAIFEASQQSNSSSPIIIDGLTIQNSHATGTAIYLEMRNDCMVRNCWIQAHTGVIFEQCNAPNQIVNCTIRTNGANEAGSLGVYLGGTGSHVLGCNIVRFDHGVRFSLGGNSVICTRMELNLIGVVVGMNRSGVSWQSNGYVIEGCTFESNRTGIEVVNGSGGLIAGNMIAGNFQSDPTFGAIRRGLDLHGATYTSSIGNIVSGYFSVACIDATNTNGNLSFISTNVNLTGGGGVNTINTAGQFRAACNF